MFGLHPRLVGLVLLGIAAVLLLVASLIGWGAVQRWRAIAAVNDHHISRLSGRANSARDSAEAAAALLPNDAMAALPAIDPAADNAGERLDRLERAVHPRQRAIVTTTAAFSAALRGSTGAIVDGANGVLIKHLAALAKGELPIFPPLPANDAPQAAILSQTAQRHAAAAWKAGNRDQLARGLGMVLLTRPAHAENRSLIVMLAALDVATDPAQFANAVDTLGANGLALVRRAVVLAPERAAKLSALIPPNQRTPDETQRVLAGGGAPGETIESLVEKSLLSPSPPLFAVLFQRSLDMDKIDLARRIADKAVEPQQGEMRIAIAQHLGDVLTLTKLQPERTDLKPTTSPPVVGPGTISFHLATPAGVAPRLGELHARADGKLVPASRIKRWGSLVMLQVPDARGTIEVDVKLDDTLVFAGRVSL